MMIRKLSNLFSLQGRDSFQFCAQKKKFMLALLTLLIWIRKASTGGF